jgi:hypothetical protein
MALDNFIGWTMADKLAMLRAVQQARLTGQVTRARTDGGVETEFDPTKTDLSRLLRELEQSIANDPNYDANDEVQAACAANRKNRVISSRYPEGY